MDVGLGKIEVKEIPEIIESKERARAGKTLAAQNYYENLSKYSVKEEKEKSLTYNV